MKRYRIEFDRETCIGAASCAAVLPEYWQIEDDGKAKLLGSKKNEDGFFILEIDEKDLEKHKEAAEACPVNAIHIIDLETGERLV